MNGQLITVWIVVYLLAGVVVVSTLISLSGESRDDRHVLETGLLVVIWPVLLAVVLLMGSLWLLGRLVQRR